MNRMTKIALAVVLAAGAFSAQAAIVDGTTASGDAMLIVYSANGYGYIRDLGSLASIETAGSISAAAAGTDANFSTFLTDAGTSAITWAIAGQNIPNSDLLLTTGGTAANTLTNLVNNSLSATVVSGTATNTNAINALTTNNTLTSVGSTIGSAITTPSSGTNAQVQSVYFDINGQVSGVLTGTPFGQTAYGATANLFDQALTPTGVVTGATADSNGLYEYNFGTVSLSSTGLLSGTAVAAVPEPGTWGLFAAGLMTVGAFARRRKAA